jgi:hypothetical protein
MGSVLPPARRGLQQATAGLLIALLFALGITATESFSKERGSALVAAREARPRPPLHERARSRSQWTAPARCILCTPRTRLVTIRDTMVAL